MYYDSHVHFRAVSGEGSAAELIPRAVAAGVTRMVAVGGDCELNKVAVDVMRLHPEHVSAAVGYDRGEAQRLGTEAGGIAEGVDRLRYIIDQIGETGLRVAAVGEIGLDFHYEPDSADTQEALLRAQLELARTVALPVIVHSRDAQERTLAALSDHAGVWPDADRPPGVLHCFTGDRPFAEALIELGYLVSFSGIVTFRNADPLRDVARVLPLDGLLVETDTPYLAPAPHRGKSNEPAFVADVVGCLADVRGEPVETVARATADNAERLFGGR